MHVLISDHTSQFYHNSLFLFKKRSKCVTKESVIIVALLWQTSDILPCVAVFATGCVSCVWWGCWPDQLDCQCDEFVSHTRCTCLSPWDGMAQCWLMACLFSVLTVFFKWYLCPEPIAEDVFFYGLHRELGLLRDRITVCIMYNLGSSPKHYAAPSPSRMGYSSRVQGKMFSLSYYYGSWHVGHCRFLI